VRRLFLLLLVATIGFVGPAAGTAHADTVSEEAGFVAKINQLRAGLGLGQLSIDPGLTTIARNWSEQMANAGDISHNPSLKDLVTLNWSKLGENVGLGPNVDILFQAFVNSPHHYANLVDPAFTHVGVGVVWRGSTMFTSHEFMTLKGGSAPVVTAPAAPRTTVTTRKPVVQAAPKPTVVAKPVVPAPTTSTTVKPTPPPPPPPPPPVASERVRWINETLRRLDPAGVR
jgi:hypothetical protein